MNRTIIAIIETVLPATPGLIGDDKTEVRNSVSAMVLERIGAMPWIYRVPVRLIAVGLEVTAMLTALGPFSVISLNARLRHLDLAARFRIPGVADLLRLITSLVVLGYYDHPKVRRRLGIGGGGW